MILPVNSLNNHIKFSANSNEKKDDVYYEHDTKLENNLGTNTRIAYNNVSNAFTVYMAKGLKGNKNANFYEFLTMGTVPYLIGSATLMAVFSYKKPFSNASKAAAAVVGQKMALGVLFYGLLKGASKTLINTPVKWMTGVDTQQPYAKVTYKIPESIDDKDTRDNEYHKIFESVEFPRWDLLYGDEEKGEIRNGYYDKVAKKLGLGTNLKDSDQEVKPLIKEIVVKSNLARNISSYLWAACGVGLAVQDNWDDFFNTLSTNKTLKTLKIPNTIDNLKHDAVVITKPIVQFGESLWKSGKSFILGDPTKGFVKRHAGKAMVGVAALSTIAGLVNIMTSSQKPSKLDSEAIIEKDRKYMVN